MHMKNPDRIERNGGKLPKPKKKYTLLNFFNNEKYERTRFFNLFLAMRQ